MVWACTSHLYSVPLFCSLIISRSTFTAQFFLSLFKSVARNQESVKGGCPCQSFQQIAPQKTITSNQVCLWLCVDYNCRSIHFFLYNTCNLGRYALLSMANCTLYKTLWISSSYYRQEVVNSTFSALFGRIFDKQWIN